MKIIFNRYYSRLQPFLQIFGLSFVILLTQQSKCLQATKAGQSGSAITHSMNCRSSLPEYRINRQCIEAILAVTHVIVNDDFAKFFQE